MVMQYKAFAVGTALVASLAVAAPASADVQITMRDGRVSIVAKDATLRQILAEWAKVGQTKILNGDRVPSGPLTLQLNNVPEAQALDTLLRTVSGYLASPRAEFVSNLSKFDRIAIVPTPAPPMSMPSASAAPPPMFQQPPVFQRPADDQEGAPNQPVFNQFPPPQVANPAQQQSPQQFGVAPAPGPLVLPPANAPSPNAAYPGGATAPVGSAVPGMIVAPPPQKKPGGGQ
jgi:hypothetical protein